ncbi:hypothetical protein ONS95_003924 [Cadophora gregata]|uniref:uncharacterized protein n=1 Tax=Cadophora gregata TaxID=51156 RepID=UPI0026DDBEF2|nr:uncharacterized protein ONS95_003924 [Cadophora gregata]KAK0107222.1 hypothetical protein ONS95_003924 [Cadophora gregata]KAK0116905.1 hypothetical protein ONS96_012751 [Cadophora gregata f. sp. sojae]
MTSSLPPFHLLNAPDTRLPGPSSTSFTLTPPLTSMTDIWRKPGPPEINTFNAPVIYKIINLATFQRVRVTLAGAWDTLYDQGGLVLIVPDPECSQNDATEAARNGQWVKSGIEFVDDAPKVGSVACDRWADWSLVTEGIVPASGGEANSTQVTIEMERRPTDDTLWVYVVQDGKRSGVREVTWLLSLAKDEDGKPKDIEAWVGVYAATPTIVEDAKPLNVKFEGFELELREL